MVYLDYITCLRYTILVGNPRFVLCDTSVSWGNESNGEKIKSIIIVFAITCSTNSVQRKDDYS